MLGTPIGSEEYIARKLDERISKERELCRAIPTVMDLQCAWQILFQSANPHANLSMRTMPPSLSATHCCAHDAGIWETAKALLGDIPGDRELEAQQLSTLPMRKGGLGLRSAERCAPAAYWASWADALPTISRRNPEVASEVVRRLDNQEPNHGCGAELQEAATLLERVLVATQLVSASGGESPPQNSARDPGEWPHGWQYWASSTLDTSFRKMFMLFGRPASCHAHLRSHSGHNAGMALSHAPTAPEFTIPPHLFRVLLLERLWLPLLLMEETCEACHEPLDPLGRHKAACPNTGRLKKRASSVERVLARICRQAGARVKFNARLREMNVGVASTDDRNIEVLAQDLPCFGGAQLAIDMTLRSAVGETKKLNPMPQTWTEQCCCKPERTKTPSS